MTALVTSLALLLTPAPIADTHPLAEGEPWQDVHANYATAPTTYETSFYPTSWAEQPVFVETPTPASLALSPIGESSVPAVPPPPVYQPTDRELVDTIFGWPGAQLVQCESGWNRWAVGRYGERGLFQIHPLWIREIVRLGWTWDDMWEVEPNIRMAAHIRRVQGLTAWTCWRG